jgi:hypothetical protein
MAAICGVLRIAGSDAKVMVIGQAGPSLVCM